MPEKIGLEAIFSDKNFRAGIANYTQKIREAEGATDKAAKDISDSSEKIGDSWEDSATRVGIAVAAMGAVLTGVATKAALTAARTEELGIVLENTAKNAGVATDAIEQQEEAIKDLGITTQVARTLQIQFLRYQLDTAKATDLARLAQDAAVISMQDSSQALAGILHGITTYNVRVLRTYGITVNLQQAFQDFAKETDRTVADLSSMEKQQIALNEVLANGDAIAGTYEAAMTSAGKQLRSMSRYVEENANAYGEHLLPAMSAVVGAGTDMLKWLYDLPTPVQATIAQMTALSGVILTVGGVALAAAPKIAKMTLALRELQIVSATGIGLGPVGIAAGVIGGLVAAYVHIQNVEKAHLAQAIAVAEASKNYDDYRAQLIAVELKTYELTEALYDQAKAAYEAGDAMAFAKFQEAALGVRELTTQLARQFAQWPDLERAMFNTAGLIRGEFLVALGEMVEDMSDLELVAAANEEQAYDLANALGLDEQQANLFVDALAQLVAKQQNYRAVIKDNIEAQKDWLTIMGAVTKEFSAADKARSASVQSTDALSQSIRDLAEETGRGYEEVAQLVVGLGFADDEVKRWADDLHLTGGELIDLAEKTGLSKDRIQELNDRGFGMGEEAISEYGDALESTADALDTTSDAVDALAREMGWGALEVLAYGESFKKLEDDLADAKETMGDFFGALVSGTGDIRDIDKTMADTSKDLKKTVGDLRRDLAGQVEDINDKYDKMLPDRTALSERVHVAGDVWDEWAFRARATTDQIAGDSDAAWEATIRDVMGAMGEFQRQGETLEDFMGRFIEKFYAGEAPDWMYIETAEFAAGMAERERMRAEDIADVTAKANQEIAEAQRVAAEKRRILEQERAERGILGALELAEATGALQEFAEKNFPDSLGQMELSAQDWFDFWKQGYVDMEGPFGDFIQRMGTDLFQALDATKSEFEDNETEAAAMWQAMQQGAADAQAELDATKQKLAELEAAQAALQVEKKLTVLEGAPTTDVDARLIEVNQQIDELQDKVSTSGPLGMISQRLQEANENLDKAREGLETVTSAADTAGTAGVTAMEDVGEAAIALSGDAKSALTGDEGALTEVEDKAGEMAETFKKKMEVMEKAFQGFKQAAKAGIKEIKDGLDKLPKKIDITVTITTTYNPTVPTATAIQIIADRLASLPDEVPVNLEFGKGIREAGEAGDRMGRRMVEAIYWRTRKAWKFPFKIAEAGGALAGIGTYFAKLYEEETLGPLQDRLDEIDKALGGQKDTVRDVGREYEELDRQLQDQAFLQMLTEEEYQYLLGKRVELADEMNALAEERVALEEELAAAQERTLQLQEAERSLDMMEQQLKLLRLIYDFDLDRGTMLAGLTFGLESSSEEWVTAMAEATRRMVEAMQYEFESGLGIASRSKVFTEYGRELRAGLDYGFFAQPMLSAPASTGGGSTTNTYDQSFDFSGTTINNGMDAAVFQAMVLQTVKRGVRGY
jgi:hypothetical protein